MNSKNTQCGDGTGAELVPLANEGDRMCAHQLLWMSARTLRAGALLDPVVAVYLANALDKVADFMSNHPDEFPGEAFAEAFNFPRRRGRQASWQTESRDLLIMVWVRAALNDRRMTMAEAKRQAAELFGLENIDRVLR